MNDRASPGEVDVAPDFLPSDDERLESLATTGRGPLRLAAAAVLAADTRKAARLARRAARLAPSAPAAEAPVAAARAAAAPRITARAARAPRTTPAPRAAAPPERRLTRARIQRARSDHQGKLLNGPRDPDQKVADERAWQRWESDQPEPDEQNGFERLDEPRRRTGFGRWRKAEEAMAPPTPAPAPARRQSARSPQPARSRQPATTEGTAKQSWRQRASAALDRLAEQEVARGARIEERVIPQIGRSNRR